MSFQTQRSSKKPWFKRAFGPLTSGGLRSSILTLTISAVGSGFLTLPVIGKENGLIALLFLVTFTAIISAIGNILLGQAFLVTGGSTYYELSLRILGKKAAIFVLIILFFYIYLGQASYCIFGKIYLLKIIRQHLRLYNA